MNQHEQNNNNPTNQLTDLPLTDEQAEQAKGGSDSLKYNFSGIEGAAGASTQPRPTSSRS